MVRKRSAALVFTALPSVVGIAAGNPALAASQVGSAQLSSGDDARGITHQKSSRLDDASGDSAVDRSSPAANGGRIEPHGVPG